MNMVNFLDGLDGLAAGVSAIAGLTFSVIALSLGKVDAAVLSAIIFGACVGFLRHNFYPARIFMGDSGALLLGFVLAAVSVQGLLKTAATVALLPLVAIRWLPGGREAQQTARTGRPRSARSPGRMAGATLRLPLIFAAATIAAGVLDSFLPLAKGIPSNLASAALLVQAITATLSRWQAGKHGDRYGHARLLIPALAVAALGMAAMIALGSPVMIFAGIVLFGAGFGVIENATFALLIEQLPEAKASALWNLAYDGGYGAGPAVFGLICVSTGYPAAFALTGVLILATLPAALRERKAAVPALAGQLPRRLAV